ncbi:hypothetical protein M9458_055468, partial [Cirrhinus mrigala]
MSASASEGESEGEADVSADQCPSAVAAPSEADAELSAMLLRAAKEIGLEVPKMPPADPSRLDDWYLGRAPAAPPRSPPVPFFPELHEELLSPRHPRRRGSQGALSHLCPRGAATWRDRPHLPSRAAYHAAGQAATALHAMATLQVYQAKALKHLHEGDPDQGAMQELRAATDFALRATKVTLRSLGQVMSTVAVQERHLWLTLAQMADVDKAAFSTLPSPRAAYSATPSRTLPSSSWRSRSRRRRSNTSSLVATVPPRPRCLNLRLPVAEGAPLRLQKPRLCPPPRHTMPDWRPDVELAAGERRRPRLRYRPLTPAGDLRSVPDAGNPEVEEIALWGTTTPTSPFPVEGRELLCAQMLPSAYGSTVPTISQKEPISSPLGSRPRVPFLSDALPPRIRTRRSISPAREPGKKAGDLASASQPLAMVDSDVMEAALSPLWWMGIRILNYLDDWLLIAHSRDVLCEHRDLVLRHLSHLGLQVNREKSKLSPVQRISFLGVELDSVNMTARLTNERAQSVLNCLNSFRHKTAIPLKTFQRLLGHMAAAAAVTPLGLLHMRPLQHWLHDRVPRWAWHRGTLRIGVSLQCRHLFSPWSRSPSGTSLQASCGLHGCLFHGLGCCMQRASSLGTGPRLQWHINCLELLAVLLALRRFRPMLRHKHVLVRTDSTATVAYINYQGGLRSRRMSQLARHLLLWSQKWLKSLRAVHIPGELNRAADLLSRQSTHPGEWRLHPQVVQLIWSHFSKAQIDLFASPESSLPAVLLPQRGSPRQGCAGTELASGAQVRLSPSEPPCTDTVQDQGGRGAGSAGCTILAHPDLVSRPHFPCGSPSLEDPLEERPSFSGDGHNLAPASRPMEPARLAPGRDASDLYHSRCPIAVVLSFLQEKLERRLSLSTLKVYVAAIAAYHDAVDRASLEGRGPTNLLCRRSVPGIRARRFSRHPETPAQGYVPKVPTTPFCDQVVNLQALPLEEADPASALLCPVRALRIYVDRTRHFRRTEQLFVCFGGQQKGNAVSKQ